MKKDLNPLIITETTCELIGGDTRESNKSYVVSRLVERLAG